MKVDTGIVILGPLHPFGKGNLASDGIQYSDTATSVTGTYQTVESVLIDPPMPGLIEELELGITWAQRCDGTTDKAVGMVQGRDKGGTWTNLITAITNTTAGTAYEEKTYSGRWEIETNFNSVPFELRVQVKSDGTANNAVGKVKNSSYYEVSYNPSRGE